MPADYSEADVIYTTLVGEGLLPERIRNIIDWEYGVSTVWLACRPGDLTPRWVEVVATRP